MSDSQSHWTVDKGIPLATVIAIVLQTGGAFWWASAVNARQDALDKRLETIEDHEKEHAKIMTDLRVTLAVINVELQAMKRIPPLMVAPVTPGPQGPVQVK